MNLHRSTQFTKLMNTIEHSPWLYVLAGLGVWMMILAWLARP